MSASVPVRGVVHGERHPWALAWGLGRGPLALLALYLLRAPLLDLVERTVGIERITYFAIGLFSTPLTRLACWLVLTLALWALCAWLAARVRPSLAWALGAGVGGVLIWGLFVYAGTSAWKAAVPVLCLATNLWPVTPAQRVHRGWSALMWGGVGVAEFFFFRRYRAWLAGLRRGAVAVPARRAALPGIAIAAALTAALLGGPKLTEIERALRMPPDVQILMEEDINGLALDRAGRYLYVTGHGLDKLRRIDTRAAGHPAMDATASSGGAQGVTYDETAGELYLFKTQTRTLQYLDAATLALRRELPLAVAPGDPWVAVDPATGVVAVASEADSRDGAAFLVLDRASGKVLDRRQEDAGNLLLHPNGGQLYLSFFRNSNRLMRYDLRQRTFAAEVPTDARVDRMAFDPSRNEVLLASPLRSAVLRFDADTLAPRGQTPSVFGVRVMAIDAQRGWMLAGSLATGEIEIRDMASGQQLRRIYLGPWLRTIVLDPSRAIAYVSANGALYEVPYGH